MHIYDRNAFRELICRYYGKGERNLGKLQKRTGIHRATILRALNTDERCSDENRAVLMDVLGIPFEEQLPFLAPETLRAIEAKAASPRELIVLDPPVAAHAELARGQELLIRTAYPEAEREFTIVSADAAARRKAVVQADAEGRKAWLYFEQGMFRPAWECAKKAIALIEDNFDLNEMLNSVRPSQSTSESLNAAYVLSRVLHIKCKILAEEIVYHLAVKLIPLAKATFAQSRKLDERLGLTGQLAHDLRWEAVMLAAGGQPSKESALKDLSDASQFAERDSLGRAYLLRDTGVVYWQLGGLDEAQEPLRNAKDALASFWDARALGPTFYVLSRIDMESRGERKSREARQYALIGGVLDPYGFVLSHAGWHFRNPNHIEERADIDDLLAVKPPFDIVHRVMSHLARGTGKTASEMIEENLARVLASGRRHHGA